MPFITEEIWQSIRQYAAVDPAAKTIMLQPYPAAEPDKIDTAAEAAIDWVKQVVVAIRNIRGEMNIPPGKPLPLLFKNASQQDRQHFSETELLVRSMAKVDTIDWLDANQQAPASATQLVGELEILVPLAGLIDKQAELERLAKEIAKLEKEQTRLSQKLGNEKFVSNAPADVVEKEQAKLANCQSSIDKLTAQQSELNAL